MTLLLTGCFLYLLGGLLALLSGRGGAWATRWGVGGAIVGSLFGLIPVVRTLLGGTGAAVRWAWNLPGGEFYIRLDGLSAFFLLPTLVLVPLAAVYGGRYMAGFRERRSMGPHWFFFNLFVLGMMLVLLARHALLFLVAWEVMSLSAFFLVTFEHERKEVRTAGWLYLIAAHIGAAVLLLLFLVMGREAGGSLDFDHFAAVGPALRPALAGLVFLLAVVGFGTKAGLVPFHIWLPEAHPAAPSHVSALMSAVMIKVGVYGVLRFMLILGHAASWWGPVLVLAGLTGAVTGVSLALFQRDIKRALAYSSIENIGLIMLALGVGFWGATRGHAGVGVLGVTAALLHVWNHALMKGVMFLGAGSVLHGAGSKDMERLGGLLKRMPVTGGVMILGALAIAGVPPLNGFVSEWLIYLSLLRGGMELGGGGRFVMLFGVGALALVGGLAMICFVRLIGIALLGTGRSEGARQAHESSWWMTLPMVLMAVACTGMALFPLRVIRLFSGVAEGLLSLPAGAVVGEVASPAVPVSSLGVLNGVVWLSVLGVGLLLVALVKRRPVATGETWGCGYPAATPRIQYTGQSFSELIVTRMYPRSLRPKITVMAPEGLFPDGGRLTTGYPDTLSRIFYQPFFDWLTGRLLRLRWLQQGKIQYYMVYFVVILFAAFAWLVLRRWIIHE